MAILKDFFFYLNLLVIADCGLIFFYQHNINELEKKNVFTPKVKKISTDLTLNLFFRNEYIILLLKSKILIHFNFIDISLI